MAITDENLWHAEERLWLEDGGLAYADLVDPEAVVALPGHGVMTGADAIAAMEGRQAWKRAEMTERHVVRSHKTVIVIAYRAAGVRPDDSTYDAWCTSTYQAAGEGWHLIQHQQTPVT